MYKIHVQFSFWNIEKASPVLARTPKLNWDIESRFEYVKYLLRLGNSDSKQCLADGGLR